jgi:hypothetical protein
MRKSQARIKIGKEMRQKETEDVGADLPHSLTLTPTHTDTHKLP